MNARKRMALLFLVGFCAGCGPTAHLRARMGTRYPAKAENCEVSFEYRDPTKTWPTNREMIGLIGVEFAADEWNAEMKSAVRPEVCRLGGNVAAISVVGVNALSGLKGANVEVYRGKGKKAAPRSRPSAPATTVL